MGAQLINFFLRFRMLQSRSIPPYVRSMGMDHRWQDFASVMNFPDTNHSSPYHHHPHYHPAAAAATSNYTSSMAATYPSHHLQISASADASNARHSLVPSTGLPGSMSDPNNVPYSGLSKCIRKRYPISCATIWRESNAV